MRYYNVMMKFIQYNNDIIQYYDEVYTILGPIMR